MLSSSISQYHADVRRSVLERNQLPSNAAPTNVPSPHLNLSQYRAGHKTDLSSRCHAILQDRHRTTSPASSSQPPAFDAHAETLIDQLRTLRERQFALRKAARETGAPPNAREIDWLQSQMDTLLPLLEAIVTKWVIMAKEQLQREGVQDIPPAFANVEAPNGQWWVKAWSDDMPGLSRAETTREKAREWVVKKLRMLC
jgi:hypothetical protein